jgi:hypothetical protein
MPIDGHAPCWFTQLSLIEQFNILAAGDLLAE